MGEPQVGAAWRPRDFCRTLQLALATIWLLDGVLQLHPFMFTPGTNGFSGMLGSMAAGNPHLVARTITWNASIVDHHPVPTDTAFAVVQLLIGFGIAFRPTLKPALALSVVWSLGVWWFGEGLGGVLSGNGTPIAGGPGAVLFYALLAVLLWPADRAGEPLPFAAARAIGADAARAVWSVVWLVLAYLALIGSGRSPGEATSVISTVDSGEPGWLAAIDRHAASALSHAGLGVAIAFAVVSLVVAAGPWLPSRLAKAALVLALVTAAVVWVVFENFGMILAGGATDPNSGLLIGLFALAYWPLRPQAVAAEPERQARATSLAGVPA